MGIILFAIDKNLNTNLVVIWGCTQHGTESLACCQAYVFIPQFALTTIHGSGRASEKWGCT